MEGDVPFLSWRMIFRSESGVSVHIHDVPFPLQRAIPSKALGVRAGVADALERGHAGAGVPLLQQRVPHRDVGPDDPPQRRSVSVVACRSMNR